MDIDIANIRKLDGGLLLVFRELLRSGNASESARRLHLSQSAVSHALARLRAIYDDPLFVRRPRGLAPTARAIELGPEIDRAIGLLHGTLADESGFDPASSSRRFVVVGSEYVMSLLGAGVINRMQSMAPDTAIEFHQLTHRAAVEGLVSGDVDLAIGRFGRAERSGLLIELLFEDKYCLVARKHHPSIAGTIDQSTYRNIGHVYSGSISEGDPWERLPAPERVRMSAIVPSWLTAFTIVASSDSVTTCPRSFAQRHAPTFGLQVVELPFELPRFSVSLLRRSSDTDLGVKWLAQKVREAGHHEMGRLIST